MTDTPPPADDAAGADDAEGRLAVQPIEIQEEVERSFLDYAMSVITARALPDARDGLKPVHRRILWGMHNAGARPDRPTVKCARIVGDVMGKYHPHGDSAIYDALVRMGQAHSLRHPLIHPKGNFGSLDDPPAAARYCVTGETLVRTAGATVPIADVAAAPANSEVDIDLKLIDHRGDLVRASKLFNSGLQPTFRLETDEGFAITGTPNHPLLCLEVVDGVPRLVWRLMEDIVPGTTVVIDRRPNEHDDRLTSEADYQLGLLAGAFVSEGWLGEHRAGFNNTDADFFTDVVEAYDRIVGGPRYVYDRTLPSGKRILELDVQRLDALRSSPLAELIGHRSADKRVPSFVWRGPLGMKLAFLQSAFEGDGSVRLSTRSSIRISYSTRSEQLARELQLLLLEFGVVATVRCQRSTGEWQLSIRNRRDVRIFAEHVGFYSAKRSLLADLLDAVPVASRAMSSDHVPFVAEYIRTHAGRGGREWLAKRNIDRFERWERYGDEILGRFNNPSIAPVVAPLIDPGFYYATVRSVTDAGLREVYSLRVDTDEHVFVAGGFVNHNTECRLAPIAMAMLDGIDEETVDFADNYDGQETEPIVLPSRFPNLLVNGSQGIAVGMATNIPPHNLGEVIDAVSHLLDNPDATPDELMEFVKGPDFPGGAMIMGRGGIMDAYRTGKGSVKMRGVAEIEEGARNDQIVITALPYQVSPNAVLNKIRDLVEAREIEGIADLNDESSKGKLRIVVKLKKDAPGLVILNNLYKRTPLQTNFAINTVALVDGVPRTLNLRDALVAYVEHQTEVIRRRSEYRLRKAEARAHIVEGLLKAIDMIDEIIAAIRASEDKADARSKLTTEPFSFSEEQAEHILDMPLSRLTRLGRANLEEELAQLRATIAELQAILSDEGKLRSVIQTELAEVRETYANDRRTKITFDAGDIDIEELIEDQDLVVVMSHKGYIKTVQADAFRTQGRGGRGIAGAKVKDEDWVEHIIHTSAHAYLLFFSSKGKVYRLKAHEIPMMERTARGTAIVNLLQLAPDERVQSIIDTRDYETNRFLFFVTRNGQVKKTKFNEYDSSLRTGIIALNLKDGDELVQVLPTNGTDDIFIVSRAGMTIRFTEEDVRPMGRAAAGVRGMKMKAEDEVVSVAVARDDAAILIVTDGGYGKRTQLDKFNRQGRGGQGVRGIKITAKKGHVVGAFMVGLDDDIIVMATGGVVIRMSVREISSQGRDATGVRVMNLDDGQSVAAVAPVLTEDSGEG